MIIKKYVGDSVAETLQKIKAEWGKEAVILNTQVLSPEKHPTGLNSHKVEITAAIEQKAKPFSPLTLVRKGEPERKEASSPTPVTTSFTSVEQEEKLKKILFEISSLQDEVLCVKERISQFFPHQKEGEALKLHFLEKDLDGQIAEKLIDEIKNKNSLQFSWKPFLVEKEGKEILSQLIPSSQKIELKEEGVTKAMFFGPVGTGKTSLLQKIAFEFGVNQKKKVLMVSFDNFKGQSSLELQRFSDLTEINFEKIKDYSEQAKILKKYPDKELILFDTSGVNPLAQSEVEELLELTSQILPDELFLVLSALSRTKDLLENLERFKDFPNFSLAFTGLDLTKRYGGVLSATIRSGKPLSYLSYGRSLVGKYEKADISRLLELMFV